MIECRTMPSIMTNIIVKGIQPPQLNYKQAVFKKNFGLLHLKRLEYKQEISMVISQLESDDLNRPLVQLIKNITEKEDLQNIQDIKEESSKRIFVIVKQAFEKARLSLSQQNKSFYEAIVDGNKILAQMSIFRQKQWFDLFMSFQNAVKIDLLPYFFHCNNEYRNSYLQSTVWSLAQIGEILNISALSIKFLRRYYNNIYPYIDTFNRQSKPGMLITVLTLARYYVRIFNMNRKGPNEYQEIYLSKTFKLENESEETSGQLSNFSIEKFNFSELAIFSKERFITSYPRLQKDLIEESMQKLHTIQTKNTRKNLIRYTMMQFHMPIRVIEHFLENINNKVEFRNDAYFQKDLQKDLCVLQKNIKYMFACYLLPIKAIQKLRLQQEYNTKLDPNFTFSHCRTDVLACFARAALAVVKQYFFCSTLQLQIEANIQPILELSKFYISYQSIKESKRQHEKSDTVMTLLIATQGNNIVFHRLYRQRLTNEKYLKQLKSILKQYKIKLPASIVMFQRQLSDHLRWFCFKNLVNFIAGFSKTRIYATINPAYGKLNQYLCSCIRTYLKFFTPIMNKELFYPLCEKLTEKVIILFKMPSI